MYLWMESNMQYLQTKVFGYWGTINILLIIGSNSSLAMNSHRLPGKAKKMGPMGHTMHYKQKNLNKKILNNTAIHLYKTSTPSTRNGAVDSQVKSNSRNNLISGQRHCGKGRNARGIITARHRGGRS
ncbi:hypothetical protein MKW94_011086 [Papaver nudicaule]|uniref:Ribosomal protein L2 n=1 Tax=Papaver nudicaule TaxID=74823 RepID=A0AA41VMZ0_PAPNU|nr:hypothetical protein [Papaver nudicaule]